jgi:gamma-butyrobetaine dioxygenase
MRITAAETIEDGAAVCVVWDGGRRARFHALWLRDNALDPATRAPGNGQRLITLLDLPAQVWIASARVGAGGSLDLVVSPEGKTLTFPADWLAARIYDRADHPAPGWTGPEIARWDGSLRLPDAADFADLRRDRAALRDWLAAVRRHGVARLRGVPRDSGAVCRVAELFGYVRETNYGRWFDVRSMVEPSNLAYTNLGLQAHTDNPYRDPVPTLQLLACLQNSVQGGHSMVVDGFSVAARLQHENPDAFRLLAGHAARFEYAGSAGVRLRSKRPVIELGPDGELLAVRFNNRSAAAPTDVPYAAMPAYYAALRRFAELVEDPAQAQEFRLDPGELFIVDNTRVLHARTALSGSGARWLQGCYADRDGLLSTLAALENEEPSA